jgi:hypothetical protein
MKEYTDTALGWPAVPFLFAITVFGILLIDQLYPCSQHVGISGVLIVDGHAGCTGAHIGLNVALSILEGHLRSLS